MTNEEAIKWLTLQKNKGILWDDYSDETKGIRENAELRIMIAYEMAIEALEQEPCEDCISRAGALRHRHIIYDDDGIGYSVVRVDEIEKLPPVTPKYTDEEIDRAQVVEQAYIDKMVELTVEESKKVGHWINLEETKYKGQVLPFWSRYECSKCGGHGEGTSNYCPNCGAKMAESEGEE